WSSDVCSSDLVGAVGHLRDLPEFSTAAPVVGADAQPHPLGQGLALDPLVLVTGHHLSCPGVQMHRAHDACSCALLLPHRPVHHFTSLMQNSPGSRVEGL